MKILFFITLLLCLSCNGKWEPVDILYDTNKVYDTIPVYDTNKVYDTISVYNNIRIYDTIEVEQLIPLYDSVTIVIIGDNNLVVKHTGKAKKDIIFNIDNDNIGMIIKNDSIIDQWIGKRPTMK